MSFHKTATRLTAGLLLVSTFITPALAAAGTVDAGSSRLRVRADSSTSAAILGRLSSGTQVEILSAPAEGWYQIAYQDSVGYVSADYIAVEEAIPAPLQSAPSQDIRAAAEPDIEEEDDGLYVRVTTSVLNVRSGPGTDYSKTGRLTAGKVVEVLETTGDWYRIEEGYISREYTRTVDLSEAEAAGKGAEIAEYALTFLGAPYVYGGSSPKGFDCSGFTQYVYKQFGYQINRTASAQLDNGTPVSMEELQPGDLVMFKKSGTGSKRASHVGIYIGGGQFVHASSPKVDTVISDLSDSYYTTGFVGGRRIV